MSKPYDPEHLRKLQSGGAVWNRWREENPSIKPDLRTVELGKSNLEGFNLQGADFYRASLWKANLTSADLSEADLSSATMNGAILKSANLCRANLRFARLVAANVEGTNLSGCSVYGCSVWNLKGNPKEQNDLVITPPSETPITVDNIEVAQFIYLLLGNPKIRSVIDTVGKKAVLILGRFTPERKAVLEAIRAELRRNDYVPILFDFEVPSVKDVHETVVTLASLVRWIVADITDPKSIPQELSAIVPGRPSLVVAPLLQSGFAPWSMFSHIQRFPWVLPVVEYPSIDVLLSNFQQRVVRMAEAKVTEQISQRAPSIERLQ